MKPLGTHIVLMLLLLLAPTGALPQSVTFTDIGAGLLGVDYGSVEWGDYDNDGDLDLLVIGYHGQTGSERIARVYRNDGGSNFTDINAGLRWVMSQNGAAAWGDYDNDGDLDILLTGYDGTDRKALLYRYDGGSVFTDIHAALEPVSNSAVAWGDYDNDGDLDILLTGTDRNDDSRAYVYRNDGGGVFTNIQAGLWGVHSGAVAWGDYDNDGDLDLVLTGYYGATGCERIARIYRNDGGGAFVDIDSGIPCPGPYTLQWVMWSAVAWGDYDNDGDLDLILAGDTGSARVTYIYRNDDGAFTRINTALEGLRYGSVAWGDYDNDGDLDILQTGTNGTVRRSYVYRNDGGGAFTPITTSLIPVYHSTAAWGDYDADGDLDIVLAGNILGEGLVTRVYRNDGAPPNTPPSAPGGPSASVQGVHVTLSWGASTDGQTPAAALSYNLRIGTTPGASDVVAAMSNGTSGWRRVVRRGNAQQRTSWTVELPDSGSYYWSVQAVDGAYAGSPFATEESFTMPIRRARWMGSLLSIIGDRPLTNVTLPGTHDSGTYAMTQTWVNNRDCRDDVRNIPFGFDEAWTVPWVTTQSKTIFEQLEGGVRYFDLRLEVDQYQNIRIYHGLRGPLLDVVLADVDRFMDQTAHELVILNFSHFCDFDANDMALLFQKIRMSLGDYLYTSSDSLPDGGLNRLTINDYVAQGSHVLVVFGSNVHSYLGRPANGVYPYGAFNAAGQRCVWEGWSSDDPGHPESPFRLAGSYTNALDLWQVKADQIRKIQTPRVLPRDVFGLHWYLNFRDAYWLCHVSCNGAVNGTLGCVFGSECVCGCWNYSGLERLSWDANRFLLCNIDTLSAAGPIGIIFTDYFENSGATTAAIALNSRELSPVSIGDDVAMVPAGGWLGPAVPNPFNPDTRISYSVPSAGHVSLQIYDVAGRLVRTLVDARVLAGDQTVTWNGLNSHGVTMPSGIYLYQLKTEGGYTTSNRMVLLK